MSVIALHTHKKTLNTLSTGCSAVVSGFQGDQCLCSRLQELGLIEGSTICLAYRLSFGGPLAVKVKGATLAIRSEDAACVLVQ